MTKGKETTPRIGLFGRRNYGKSTLMNLLVGQQVSIVDGTPGTTTDAVRKTTEIKGIGPVVLIDTAGMDDQGDLGARRVEAAQQVLGQVDMALILFTNNDFGTYEQSLIQACRQAHTPFLLLYSQADKYPPRPELLHQVEQQYGTQILALHHNQPHVQDTVQERIRALLPTEAYAHKSLLGDVLRPGDVVVMVTPIDASAPEGRMILPQVQVLRDILDNDCTAVTCKETDLAATLFLLNKKPRVVVTDSQAYHIVNPLVPNDIYLTSFSVVLARAKSNFEEYLRGVHAIAHLSDGDNILIMESCTHTVTCEDIGRVKLPRLLTAHTGKQLHFQVVSGMTPPPLPPSNYRLAIQCGGCVHTPQQISAHITPLIQAGVPVTNYGLAIAYLNGILERSVAIFQHTHNHK